MKIMEKLTHMTIRRSFHMFVGKEQTRGVTTHYNISKKLSILKMNSKDLRLPKFTCPKVVQCNMAHFDKPNFEILW